PAWPVTVSVAEDLPGPVAETFTTILDERTDLFVRQAGDVQASVQADVQLSINPDDADATMLAEWTYTLVAPFPTITDGVTWTHVISHWRGQPAGPFAGQPLLMTEDTATVLGALLGSPAAGAVETAPAGEILQRAWDNRPTWAIVPFDQLEPRWKVLYIDGVSVLDQRFDIRPYPLTIRVGATGLPRGAAKFREQLERHLTNRDPARMSVVVLTGVTALTRATAMRMQRHGVTYPAEDIQPWLVEGNITHISNEVSFAKDCPPPGDYYTMVFCADPSYFELLEYIDVDVVELTGNHLLDWGLEAMKLSLMMYDTHGISYYGGGWNVKQALQPLTLTHGVHTFGFLGCNPAGPRSAWATEGLPGSAPCNFGQLADQLGPTIHQLRQDGVIPIVTLQYLETYSYEPTASQRAEFRALSELGAVIVSGSQAHQPQAFDFVDGAFIHYGLGNLFFDQMQSLGTRQEFIDRHVFYDGRHVSTELLTAMLEDYARPRPMTPEEREALLTVTFAASGWE
ncbi:MAG TPA: hypothetical protein ENN19_04415, partial [Chloroflexi bacterium]|nr:hypothetical protein [Chloroflexota bacterium]